MRTAGPAWSAAALPVRTKMPAPIMQPMPRKTRFHGPRERFSSLVRVSSWIWATLLRSPIRPRKVLRGAAVAIVNIPLGQIKSLAAEPSACSPEGNSKNRHLSREHGPERLAAEDVDMKVRHFLAAALADVGEQAVAL